MTAGALDTGIGTGEDARRALVNSLDRSVAMIVVESYRLLIVMIECHQRTVEGIRANKAD
jgi:hypothetical protein